MSGQHTPLYENPRIYERRRTILGVMAASLTLVVMSVSGLNVALPTIQESLVASNSALQWITDSYALVFAGLLLMAGALGDRFGRRNALLAGLSIFAVGATIGGLATTATQVVAGRSVMGAGAAFVMPATLSLVSTLFSTGGTPPRHRHLGRVRRCGCGDRPNRVGRAARGVLVGIGSVVQPPGGAAAHGRHRCVRATLA